MGRLGGPPGGGAGVGREGGGWVPEEGRLGGSLGWVSVVGRWDGPPDPPWRPTQGTNKQTDRQTNRQTNRQTDREIANQDPTSIAARTQIRHSVPPSFHIPYVYFLFSGAPGLYDSIRDSDEEA